jgi:hypothetical protein
LKDNETYRLRVPDARAHRVAFQPPFRQTTTFDRNAGKLSVV